MEHTEVHQLLRGFDFLALYSVFVLIQSHALLKPL